MTQILTFRGRRSNRTRHNPVIRLLAGLILFLLFATAILSVVLGSLRGSGVAAAGSALAPEPVPAP